MTAASDLWIATKAAYPASGLVTLTNITDRSAVTINDTWGTSAAQHVIDLWLPYAQIAYDPANATHVAAGIQCVIAVLWRRGGASSTIEQVKWDSAFGDDGILGRIRKTGPRAHGIPKASGNTRAKTEGDISGFPIRPWADQSSLPVNYPPQDVSAVDQE